MSLTTTAKLPSNLFVQGDLTVAGVLVGIDRTDLVDLANQSVPIPNTAWRRWDSLDEYLSSVPAGDDLGVFRDTLGTDMLSIQTQDLGDESLHPTTQRAGIVWTMGYDYVAGTNINFVAHAGALTAVASASMTLDLEAYLHDGSAAVGSDLNGTAAQSINSVTLADYTFVIDGSGVSPGDQLELRISIAVNDTGTAIVRGQISNSQLVISAN